MAINVPSYTANNISFGPGRLFVGAAGTTPTVNVGAITEDAVEVEFVSEKRWISQGNPKHKVLGFTLAEDVMVRCSGIEWDFDNFVNAVGAGATTTSASQDTLVWGGDPLIDEVAIHVQHYMAKPGHTLNAYIWKASGNGGLKLSFSHEEHQFAYEWAALRATTNWAGGSLGSGAELMQLVRQKT